MMKTWLGFGDLALIFKVTAEVNRSNLNQLFARNMVRWGTTVFSESNTETVSLSTLNTCFD